MGQFLLNKEIFGQLLLKTIFQILLKAILLNFSKFLLIRNFILLKHVY